MNCNKCKAEWSPPKDRTVTKCPFCAEPLFGFSGTDKNTAPHEMLLKIVQQYDKTILTENRLKGLIADLIPNTERKYLKIIKQAVDDGIGAKLLDLEGKDMAARIASVTTIKSNFKNNNAFTDTADYVIDCFLYALGWLKNPPEEKANQILIDKLSLFNEQLNLAFSDGHLTKDESHSLFVLAKSLSISENEAADLIQLKIRTLYFIPDIPPDKSSKTSKDLICSRIWKVDDKFESVKIGDQVWMKRNLDVSHFRNGDPIPEAKTNEEWEKAGKQGIPAWCYYNNDPELGKHYGKLYNWFAVNDLRGLAPEGWHVPSNDEWVDLVDYVVSKGYSNNYGDPNSVGNALKSCRQVNSSLGDTCNTIEHPRWDFDDIHHGFDKFGFSALPGSVFDGGSFYGLGAKGYWWSADGSSAYAWGQDMGSNYGGVYRSFLDQSYGFSVRCLRNFD